MHCPTGFERYFDETPVAGRCKPFGDFNRHLACRILRAEVRNNVGSDFREIDLFHAERSALDLRKV